MKNFSLNKDIYVIYNIFDDVILISDNLKEIEKFKKEYTKEYCVVMKYELNKIML